MKIFALFLCTEAFQERDGQCIAKDGECKHWPTTICIAGWEQYICNGDNNRRCCLPCDAVCQAKEDQDAQRDDKCTAIDGKCQHDTNFCGGGYVGGICGGSATRKCCQKAPEPTDPPKTGEHYWNEFVDYTLSTYASTTNYKFTTLNAAKERCIELGKSCSGVTRESTSAYTVRRYYTMSKRTSYISYTKGVKFAANFIPRSQWGARSPTGYTNFEYPAEMGIVGHHTAGHPCFNYDDCVSRVRGTQNYHMDSNGWSDIGYNFLIGEDGNIYEGRGVYARGAHAKEVNGISYGWSIMGDFTSHLPNSKSQAAAKQLMNYLVDEGFVDKECWQLKGHRDVGNTACPGNAFYPVMQTWDHYFHKC